MSSSTINSVEYDEIYRHLCTVADACGITLDTARPYEIRTNAFREQVFALPILCDLKAFKSAYGDIRVFPDSGEKDFFFDPANTCDEWKEGDRVRITRFHNTISRYHALSDIYLGCAVQTDISKEVEKEIRGRMVALLEQYATILPETALKKYMAEQSCVPTQPCTLELRLEQISLPYLRRLAEAIEKNKPLFTNAEPQQEVEMIHSLKPYGLQCPTSSYSRLVSNHYTPAAITTEHVEVVSMLRSILQRAGIPMESQKKSLIFIDPSSDLLLMPVSAEAFRPQEDRSSDRVEQATKAVVRQLAKRKAMGPFENDPKNYRTFDFIKNTDTGQGYITISMQLLHTDALRDYYRQVITRRGGGGDGQQMQWGIA